PPPTSTLFPYTTLFRSSFFLSAIIPKYLSDILSHTHYRPCTCLPTQSVIRCVHPYRWLQNHKPLRNRPYQDNHRRNLYLHYINSQQFCRNSRHHKYSSSSGIRMNPSNGLPQCMDRAQRL